MKVREKKWIRFRIYLVAGFFLIGLCIIAGRAFQLQVLEKDKLAAIARDRYRVVVNLPPKRGTIFDREKHELAVSIEVGSIYAHPKLVKNKNRASMQLAKILQLKRRVVLDQLKSKRSFVWIARKTSPDKIRDVKAVGIEGIGFTTESRRYYPGREIASHLIGFAGADNQGLEGLEKKYDGAPGFRILLSSVEAVIPMVEEIAEPEPVEEQPKPEKKKPLGAFTSDPAPA